LRVLVADPLSETGLEVLRRRGLEADVRPGLGEDDLVAAVPAYDALVVRSATQVTRRVLEAGTRLRVVGRAGVGIDNIDEDAATERGILVMNTPLGNTLSAAEHTCALLLSLARRVPQAVASLRAGAWEKKAFAGVELSGKTLGIVGFGRIGREVAARARAFGMRLLVYDPYISTEVGREASVELAPLDRLLAESDFVTLHTPLTAETQRLLGPPELGRMKKGAYLLNVARGGLVDEEALADALRTGRLAGAAFDVFAHEPPTGSPLLSLPNFIGTPHLGASTSEAQEKVSLQIAEQVVDFLLEGKIANAVNMPHPVSTQLQPYVDLAHGMGAFAVQLARGHPEAVHVTCRGEVARFDTHGVATAALAGVLSRSTPGTNLINAERRARDHGIQFVQSKTEAVMDYAASLEVVLQSEAGETVLRGTTLARLGPRIVEVNGYEVEFKPHGRFLVVQHRDQPGTVARISSILGRENINIAQMVVGRLEPRGPAVSILRVDDPVPPQVVDELRDQLRTPDVRFVTVPRLGAARDGSDH
jgi:D-3-phosphoglycerate dehydrogenase / 2-oxoglutarate reductase